MDSSADSRGGATVQSTHGVNRRDFIRRAGAAASGGWLAAAWPELVSAAAFAREAHRSGAPLRVLTAAEATELDAISAQIIPSDDQLPGAREAGVVQFIDRALETFMAGALDGFRSGLGEFEDAVRAAHPEAASFASLPHEAQSTMMLDLVERPLFGTIRFLTLAGMFALPSYGGNQNGAGWRLIGFDDRHVWEPPFGYYDAREDAE